MEIGLQFSAFSDLSFLSSGVTIALLSPVGIKLCLINLFIRNVGWGYSSLHPSFRGQAGR